MTGENRHPQSSSQAGAPGRISLRALIEPDRLRRIVTPSGEGVRGFYPSLKAGRMVEYESRGERNTAALLDEIDVVLTFREQPRRELWWDGQKVRRYTPDVEVVTVLGPVLVEVKTARDARRPKLRRKHALIRASLASRGLAFIVWTERHVSRPARARAHLLAAAGRGMRLREGASA